MKLENYDSIYFLGIGGIGMSAQARWFMKKGLRVAGYDKTPTVLTEALQNEGMLIHFEDSVDAIPSFVKEGKERTLVIFTPAIPKDHVEHAYLRENGFAIVKRSEVLGMLTKNYKTIAVAGTHGKTYIPTLIRINKEDQDREVRDQAGIATAKLRQAPDTSKLGVWLLLVGLATAVGVATYCWMKKVAKVEDAPPRPPVLGGM